MKNDEKFGKIVKSEEVTNGLISLIDKRKSSFHGGISEIMKREFELIAEARNIGASWTDISKTIGFDGKGNGIAVAFWRERRRREKKGVKTETRPARENAKTEKKEEAPTRTIPKVESKREDPNDFFKRHLIN